MNAQSRDDPWTPVLTFAILAGIGLFVWAVLRKRGASTALLPPIAPPPLVSPWSPMP